MFMRALRHSAFRRHPTFLRHSRPLPVILSEAKNLAFRMPGHDAGGVVQKSNAGISSPHPDPLPQGEREEEWGCSCY